MNVFPALVFFAISLVSKTLAVRLCGKQLADMLDLVCDGRGFNVMYPTRHIPRLSKRTASQYLSVSRSQTNLERGGIVSECCRNSCSIATLERYCAAPSGTYYENHTGHPVSEDMAEELRQSENHRQEMVAPQTTPPPVTTTTTTLRPILRILSRVRFPRPYSRNNPKSSNFIFVRPLGDAPTRSPVVS